MRSSLSVVVIALVAGLSCGGSSAVQPRPLGHHLEPKYFDSVDPAKQEAAVSAKGEYEMAQLQRNKLRSDLGEVDLKVLKAKNEAKAAALSMESAKAQEKAAKLTADGNKMQEAAAAVNKAQLEKDIADARMDYIVEEQKTQQKQLRAAEFSVYAAESKWELEKAAVLVNNNITPGGFKYNDYEAQQKQRIAEAVKAKQEADQAAARLEDKRRQLEEKEKAFAGAK